jgi:arginine decarboxylase
MQSGMIPRKFFLTKGVGRALYELESFEMALRDANIQSYNLVFVSSILPPGCQKVSPEEGNACLSPGEIVFSVLAQRRSSDEGSLISASIGVAHPKDDGEHGYLCEHTDGYAADRPGLLAEARAARMLGTSWGIAGEDMEKAGPGLWSVGGKQINTENISMEATVGDGEWCTVLSAIVFIP